MGFSVSTGKESVKSEPNVVPLCDVLLVLLIIFMVVTPLVQKGVDVKLPNALNTANMSENPEVVLAVKQDGTLYVKSAKVKDPQLENLPAELEDAYNQATDKKLYIRADEDVEYSKIVELLDIIRESGFEEVGFITEKKTEKVD